MSAQDEKQECSIYCDYANSPDCQVKLTGDDFYKIYAKAYLQGWTAKASKFKCSNCKYPMYDTK